MVAPAIVAAGITAAATVVGGLINAYQAGKARDMEQAKLDQIAEVIRSLIPPHIDVSPERLVQAPHLIMEEVKLAPLNYDKIKPAEYRVIRDFIPEVAPLIEEQAPQLVEKTARGREGERAFGEALQEMLRVGRAGGDDPIARAATARAMEAANREAQGRHAAIAQDMARRGMAGSGMEVAMALQGASDAMGRAGTMARDAQADAYLRSLQAMRDAGRMGREQSLDEMALAGRNADIINAFNARTTLAAQRQADRAADIRNRASERNLGRAETVADATEAARYQAAVDERNYFNDLAFREAGFSQSEIDRLNRTAGSQFGMDMQVQDDLLRRQMMPFEMQKDIVALQTGQYGRELDAGQRHAGGRMQQVSDIFQGAGQFGAAIPGMMGSQQQTQTAAAPVTQPAPTPAPTPAPSAYPGAPSYALTEEQEEREAGKRKGHYVKA